VESDQPDLQAAVATVDRALDTERPVKPRPLRSRRSGGDLVFRGLMRGAGGVVLLVTGGIGLFLGWKAIPVFRDLGWSFFTTSGWDPDTGRLGIEAVLVGTLECAAVAICVAFPLALGLALFISEYAAPGLKRVLISLVDLMAAIPSVVFGLWGVFFLMPRALFFSHWLAQNMSFIPIFVVRTNPNAANWDEGKYTSSLFIAGLVVSLMVMPMACSVMREVFSLCPPGEKEAALALGSTRWGMIRLVLLPFGRGGIIGGTMLGLGRALGETIAALMILSLAFDVKIRILELGGSTTSVLIATRFGDSTSFQLSALLAAGLVLFLITLAVNMGASVLVGRSRSGASSGI
jgi:phosphate transport system permease protein